VPRDRHRVHPEHLAPRSNQSQHPRAALGLDPDLHPVGSVTLRQVCPLSWHARGDQRVQLRDPGQSFWQPLAR
jgi:hypothetical protein